MSRSNLLGVLITALALTTGGCSSTNALTGVEAQTVNEVQVGWTTKEVTDLIGKPRTVNTSGKTRTYFYEVVEKRNVAGCGLAAAAAPVTMGLSVVFCSAKVIKYRITFVDDRVTAITTHY